MVEAFEETQHKFAKQKQLIIFAHMNKAKQGGRRPGAGRKSMYGEAMTTISFRVPKSVKENVRQMIRSYLQTLKIENKKHDPEYGC
jgi:hypothetical protein